MGGQRGAEQGRHDATGQVSHSRITSLLDICKLVAVLMLFPNETQLSLLAPQSNRQEFTRVTRHLAYQALPFTASEVSPGHFEIDLDLDNITVCNSLERKHEGRNQRTS